MSSAETEKPSNGADSAEATPSIFNTGPSKKCSECKSWFTGQHFCWGTYPG